MNNLEDTGEITARQRAAVHIADLLDRRAKARPPRCMMLGAVSMGVLFIFDLAIFGSHLWQSRHRAEIGVALAVHLALFAVICLLTVYMAVTVARVRIDMRRSAEQDQIDSYREDRWRQQRQADVDTILEALSEVSESLRQAKVGKLIEDLAYGDEVVPIGRRRTSS